jgi:protease secretion system membrane fusion protein
MAETTMEDTGGSTPMKKSARLGRVGITVLVLGLLGLLAWAALAPLDEGVPTMATVAIDTKRKAVQHLQGGIVREVLVREGDEVKEGQTLVRLDDAVSKANYEATRQRYLALRAMESRLQAEQAGREGRCGRPADRPSHGLAGAGVCHAAPGIAG